MTSPAVGLVGKLLLELRQPASAPHRSVPQTGADLKRAQLHTLNFRCFLSRNAASMPAMAGPKITQKIPAPRTSTASKVKRT